MIRVRFMTSRQLDQDVEAQIVMLTQLPRVDVVVDDDPLPNRFALILRRAFRTLRNTRVPDVMVTAGEPALVAAAIAWRGALVHLPVGDLSNTERRLLLWRKENATLAVCSTHRAAIHAIRQGIDSSQIRVIRPLPPALHATREQIRANLGIAPSTVCVLLAGRVNGVGSHPVALCASSVLAFRDPSWRMIMDPGVHTDYVVRTARSTSQPESMVLCPDCSAPELAAASDVALIDPQSPPSFVSIASAAMNRVPIVADPATWKREQLQHVPATLVHDRKSRTWARAAIERIENPSPDELDRAQSALAASCRFGAIAKQWLEVLQIATGRRKPLAA